MIRIGTRGSVLALTQTNWARDRLLQLNPGLEAEIVVIRTSADRDQTTSLRSSPSTGVFVKELEDALLAARVDLAVHSLKDVPTTIPPELDIVAVPPREDSRDALITRADTTSIGALPGGAVVGTGSLRRAAQLLALRPDLRIRDIRGNVDTRLRKLDSGEYDALLLACAGLSRLGLSHRISARLEFAEMLPAPGQGALALQARSGDRAVRALVEAMNDPATAAEVDAERAFLSRLGGGCNIPIGVHAEAVGDELRIEGVVAAADGSRILRESAACPIGKARDAGSDLAAAILAAGGSEILAPAGAPFRHPR